MDWTTSTKGLRLNAIVIETEFRYPTEARAAPVGTLFRRTIPLLTMEIAGRVELHQPCWFACALQRARKPMALSTAV
jgi:hypothetical protein